MVATSALAGCALSILAGLVLAAATSNHRPAMLAVTAAGILAAIAGVALMLGASVSFVAGEVLGFALIDVQFDALSGLFLVALGVVGAAASIFGLGYRDAGRSRFDTVIYALFVASLGLVFGSASAFSFLFAWEAMAITSALLVIGPRPTRAVARSGYVYLAMTHVGTAAIAVAFAIWAAAAGSFSFADWGAASSALDGSTRDLLFVLLLVGFGTKAGVMPLHVWLPRAHPVAPSHVSALLSGVMIKAGIYGIVAFGIGLLGPGPAWWGLLVLAVGAASAILGVLYALSEHDLKRLLAFSSIENIGIILMGLAVAMVGSTAGTPALVVGGLTAALFHVLNHALSKSLLFLGAGAVGEAAHSRDLNRLGGLARVMPLTALAFGVGAAAISALPPTNGFASEWLTFQALLGAGGSPTLDAVVRFACYAAVGALGLTAALAAAAFVKATGMTFLALPRTDSTAAARDIGRAMAVSMALVASLCVAVGIAAGPIGGLIAGVARSVDERSRVSAVVVDTLPPPTLGVYQPALLVLALAGVGVAVLALYRAGAAPARRAPTWTCGIVPEPGFEYTATSFSKPIRLFFEPVLRPGRELLVEYFAGTPFPRRVTYRSEVDHVVETRVYGPLHRAGIVFSQWARRLQQGTLQLYLAYTVGTVVILLLLLRAW